MKPLNREERNRAFLRFLLLFIITIGLVVAVIFFSIEVPDKESEGLRQRIKNLQDEKELADSLNVVMKEAVEEINNFDAKKEPPAATFQRVQNKIEIMNGLLRRIPNSSKTIYGLSVQNLDDLNKAKSKLASLIPQ